MAITDIKINDLTEPFGVDELFSVHWRLSSDKENVRQQKFRLKIFLANECIFDTEEKESDNSFVSRPDVALVPYSTYTAELSVWDNHGDFASKTASFYTGRCGEEWTSKWICADFERDEESDPTYIFKKGFDTSKEVLKAIVFASALGCYNLKVNGMQASDEYFAPGFTDYNRIVQYNAYDITHLLRQGKNNIEFELASGWYSGRLGLMDRGHCYGNKRALIAEVRITYVDGTVEIISSNEIWQVTKDGPRRYAGFFDGEIYDAKLENTDHIYSNAKIYCGPVPKIVSAIGVPVKKQSKIVPKLISIDEKGKRIYDFGKNFAGIVGINIDIPSGKRIKIRHGEILRNGKLYTDNLRTAKAELVYISKGRSESYEPRFTYMGFRYAEVSGIEDSTYFEIYAYELYSDCQIINSFTCSDQNLNQLHMNILTSQKANFVEIPTDCPQRDERCGWTGDIAMYCRTAVYNMDITRFMRKWLRDLRSCQRESGEVPIVIPDLNSKLIQNFGDPVWGDAAIIVPWAVYQASGDIGLLEECYESMKAWFNFQLKKCTNSDGSEGYIWNGFHFGDWLAPNCTIEENASKGRLTATAYFAHCADILKSTANVLGKAEDRAFFDEKGKKIREEFYRNFVNNEGYIKEGFQSIYALGVAFDILNEPEKAKAVEALNSDIIKNDYHLTSGFVGTPFVPFALSEYGYFDTAFKLLMQDTCPSWLYCVKKGATSIWERWDAIREDGTTNDEKITAEGASSSNMVSFNHYAYGAIGEWIYKNIVGLKSIEPGFKKVEISPKPGTLTFVSAKHESVMGTFSIDWSIKEGKFMLEVQIPANTSARIVMPDGQIYETGSGRYVFNCNI